MVRDLDLDRGDSSDLLFRFITRKCSLRFTDEYDGVTSVDGRLSLYVEMFAGKSFNNIVSP